MKRTMTVMGATLGVVLMMGLSARAADDPAAELAKEGAKIVAEGNGQGAAACSACHGKDGAGNGPAKYPRLAGLDSGYLARQLEAYMDGGRANPIMKPIGAALSDQEMRAVSTYFARLDTPSSAGAKADKKLVARGEKIAKFGDWSKNVPACTTCHGPQGQGIGAAFPALAGQHAGYIEAQMAAWKSGQRKNDPNGLMKSVAEGLSEEQTKAVAAYFASLPVADATKQ